MANHLHHPQSAQTLPASLEDCNRMRESCSSSSDNLIDYLRHCLIKPKDQICSDCSIDQTKRSGQPWPPGGQKELKNSPLRQTHRLSQNWGQVHVGTGGETNQAVGWRAPTSC